MTDKLATKKLGIAFIAEAEKRRDAATQDLICAQINKLRKHREEMTEQSRRTTDRIILIDCCLNAISSGEFSIDRNGLHFDNQDLEKFFYR